MTRKHLSNINTKYNESFRVFFIEYCIYSLYITFENDDPDTGSYKVKIYLMVLFASIVIVVLGLISSYIYDVNQLIMDNWPFRLNVYKSPLNPKVAPVIVACVAAITIIWKLWKKRNILSIVQHYQNEDYKSQGWILFIIIVSFISASVLFSKTHPLVAAGILLVLFGYIHVSGKLSKAKKLD